MLIREKIKNIANRARFSFVEFGIGTLLTGHASEFLILNVKYF